MAEGEEARLVRMLSDFDMQDDAADLAKYGIRRPGDLAYLDEDLINNLPVTPICKAKLRRLAKSVGAVDDRPRTSVDPYALASAQNTGFSTAPEPNFLRLDSPPPPPHPHGSAREVTPKMTPPPARTPSRDYATVYHLRSGIKPRSDLIDEDAIRARMARDMSFERQHNGRVSSDLQMLNEVLTVRPGHLLLGHLLHSLHVSHTHPLSRGWSQSGTQRA